MRVVKRFIKWWAARRFARDRAWGPRLGSRAHADRSLHPHRGVCRFIKRVEGLGTQSTGEAGIRRRRGKRVSWDRP